MCFESEDEMCEDSTQVPTTGGPAWGQSVIGMERGDALIPARDSTGIRCDRPRSYRHINLVPKSSRTGLLGVGT